MSANVYSNDGFTHDDINDNNNSNSNNNSKKKPSDADSKNINKTAAAVTVTTSGSLGRSEELKRNNTDGSLNNAVTGNDDITNNSAKSLPPSFGSSSSSSPAKTTQDEDSAFYSVKKDGGSSGCVDFTLPHLNSRERLGSIVSDGPYRGMGKEELLRYSSRPLWRNLRYAFMSIVLTGWLALLITVVALVLTYPHCRHAQRKDWWQKTVVYRIYVRSFLDTNTDGIGDINGIIHQLDYLKETGVGTISLSPIYKLSPNAPADTHVVNHLELDPVFGTMDEFKHLVNKTHALGMNILLDFIPNHTSDQHPWFQESKANGDPRENVYRSYYVWEEGLSSNHLTPPNSWQSVYNCSAWTLTTEKNSHYLHQFTSDLPDLNLRSEKVRVELEKILQFWLDAGVDGFYIRDTDFLFEDYDLRDDFLHDNTSTIAGCKNGQTVYPYEAYNHTYTKGLTELFDMLARWRAFLDDYGNKTNSYKMLIADVDADYDHVINYYGLFNRDGVDFPLNKFSLNLSQGARGGRDVAELVNGWLSRVPLGRWPNWMGGDDRSPRLIDRLGPEMAMPYLVMTMLLPGTPYLYYGDEIGMGRSLINQSMAVPGGREMEMRGPMLWDNRTHSGFCSQFCLKPWIAPYAGYKNTNVEVQKRDPYSMWHLFRNLTQLRRDYPSFEYGDYVRTIQDQQVFSFVREFDGEKGFLVALNFAKDKVKKHFTGTHDTIPSSGTIEIVTGRTSRRRGNGIDLDPLTLEPYQGVVVSWDYVAEEI